VGHQHAAGRHGTDTGEQGAVCGAHIVTFGEKRLTVPAGGNTER
jgi:hypothetical protein